MIQLQLIDVGPRVAGARAGMTVVDKETGKRCKVVEVAEPPARFSIYAIFHGDVTVLDESGRLRVLGPQPYLWTKFELVEETA